MSLGVGGGGVGRETIRLLIISVSFHALSCTNAYGVKCICNEYLNVWSGKSEKGKTSLIN